MTENDAKEVYSLVAKVSGYLDNLGRAARDLRLAHRTHPEWGSLVLTRVRSYEELMRSMLSQVERKEAEIVDAVIGSLMKP